MQNQNLQISSETTSDIRRCQTRADTKYIQQILRTVEIPSEQLLEKPGWIK